MHKLATLDAVSVPAKRGPDVGRAPPPVLALGAFLALNLVCTAAHCIDGCAVLLCLAAPKWSAIPQCVPPIRELFRDLARGRSFPTCAMASTGDGEGDGEGSTNSATNAWASTPSLCPPQYTHLLAVDRGAIYSCDYTGVISVTVNSALFTRTWWNTDGQTVTEFTSVAKAQLGMWDPQFDDDYAAWLAARSTSASSETR